MHPESGIGIAGIDVYHIAFYAEVSVVKVGCSSRIQTLHQAMQQFGTGNHLILLEGNDVFLELYGVSNPV